MVNKLANMTVLFLTVTLISCNKKIIAQKQEVSFTPEKYNESIWIPNKTEESYLYKINDTIQNRINLIFETSFNDSIQIDVDGKTIYTKVIVTEKKLSVVNQEFVVNTNNDTSPSICIRLMESKKLISFRVKKGYAICYLSRQNEIWSLEYSNYQRLYY